ncbi:MAG: glucuronate isomerase [Candidatus Lokiarchaeota archaeon]|nr:glucuronate isomerase [Candidatus Lokiarchaeota archaeon]MBD3342841.1 glucuronate isomerase [Candidatus Lokiarchaeota archaeon]
MNQKFITEDFLLYSRSARELFHNYAKHMPIFDYHSHLPPEQIANDVRFDTITQIWLYGDHYKWRLMRTFGIDEDYITGNKSDYDKFRAWAKTVPYTIRNPIYHWTHLELKTYFGIDDKLLNAKNADDIYNRCNVLLKTEDFSVKNLLRKFKVKVVCTTDDPTSSLEHHKRLRDFEIKILPTFRPDKGMTVENPSVFNQWVDELGAISNTSINDFDAYIAIIKERHDFFHQLGCRISDHGMETIYAEDYNDAEIAKIFKKIRNSNNLNKSEVLKFKSAMMMEYALMDNEKNWTQMLHIGAMRNNNTRLYQKLGPDVGCDSIGDFKICRALSKFLDRLDKNNNLPKTILFNLNPRDNALMASMIGNFQDGTVKGKLQYGPAWWFLDTKEGMINQLNVLSDMSMLSQFVGMVTDSRSFLSYPRHEYFRRILCNLIGKEIDKGEIPEEFELMGEIIKNICYNNAKNYFGLL